MKYLLMTSKIRDASTGELLSESSRWLVTSNGKRLFDVAASDWIAETSKSDTILLILFQ